jgi:hypothetical protein
LTLGLGGTAWAFHGGGVAHCDGCHTMHGVGENAYVGAENELLLIGGTPSDTCLNCHAKAGRSYNILSNNGSSWTPGGDYFWLTASYSNVIRGNTVSSDPDNMGHNVISPINSIAVDGTNTQAPGGTYPSSNLGCSSCHDPHGQVQGGTSQGQLPISVSGSYGADPAPGTIAGNYRLLGDSAYAGANLEDAPIAVTAGFGETDASHPAYGQGMSEWCGSCHTDFVDANFKHPAGNTNVLGTKADTYNNYVATGDWTGVQGSAYTALVPFERQETVRATLLAAVTSTAGPEQADNVMCLTCHRAHASAFNNATRWDMETEFLAESLPSAANLGAMGVSDVTAPYYGRDIATEFGEYQRSLCNKCHVKD